MTPWGELRGLHPWPARNPNFATRPHGWLSPGTKEMLLRFLVNGTEVIELGSWLGRSARFMLDNCSRLRLVCVDHWMTEPGGSNELRTQQYAEFRDGLYEKFLTACWPYRDRIVPILASTTAGMWRCRVANLRPSMIYVDASHEAEHVRGDIQIARQYFPAAVLVGDDWRLDSVKAGVELASRSLQDGNFTTNSHAWAFIPAGGSCDVDVPPTG